MYCTPVIGAHLKPHTATITTYALGLLYDDVLATAVSSRLSSSLQGSQASQRMGYIRLLY